MFAPTLLALTTLGFGGSDGLQVEEPIPAIYGGQTADVCQWPTAVSIRSGGGVCSATLVHPEVVLFAAHCGTGQQTVDFGETRVPKRSVPTRMCNRNPNYSGGVGGDDYAYCVLAEPVLDIPITPIVYGCETEILHAGREAAVVGFGDSEGGSNVKRWGMTEIFRSETNFIQVGGGGTGASFGDSGGPAYVQYPDGSWHAFGIVSGGSNPGSPVVYSLMNVAAPWVESETGIDITPCHDRDGTWAPTPWCDRFSMTPMTGTTWSQGCAGDGHYSTPSSTCGSSWDTVADDVPPVISVAAPENNQVYDDEVSLAIEVEAFDEGHGVKRVWLEVNGHEVAEDAYEPWDFGSAVFPEGQYLLRVWAEDWAGNATPSEYVAFGVGAQPPALPSEDDDDDKGGCRIASGEPQSPMLGLGLIVVAVVARRRRLHS